MKEKHLKYLRCPLCESPLALDKQRFVGNSIKRGILLCNCQEYRIKEGILKMLKEEDPNGYQGLPDDAYSEEYYASLEKRYKDHLKDNKLQMVSEYIGDIEGKIVGDLGCGSGIISALLVSKGADLLSLDFSTTALKLTAENLNSYRNSSWSLIQANVENLPIKDQTFDIIVATDLIEHLFSPSGFLREMSRTLRQNGLLILSTDNVYPTLITYIVRGLMKFNIRSLSAIWNRKQLFKDLSIGEEHIYLYSPFEIKNLIESHGFQVIKYDFFNLSRCPSAPSKSIKGRLFQKLRYSNGFLSHNLLKFFRGSMIFLLKKSTSNAP